MTDYLGNAYPQLASTLKKWSFASSPTPISHHELELSAGSHVISVKHDDQTHTIYGGNKVRKLEYILQRAKDRGAKRLATFGAVGSNHALATAIFAKEFGFDCTCFLAHQRLTQNISRTLMSHLVLGTELVRWGGGVNRLELYRRYLQGRRAWVIPLGGTCWLGIVGFVNAGLELAAQIEAGEIRVPDRIYIANGTMGSVAGLAIGLALARLPTEIHAVRVADNRFVRRGALDRLMKKTVTILNRFDPKISTDASMQTRIVWRNEFYAGGYAWVDDNTAQAAEFAKSRLGLDLDTTYTAKAMAALLHDLEAGVGDEHCLFWNTYNSRPLPTVGDHNLLARNFPEEFERYFE
jgi:D-cysteine desulfhydrase